MDRTTYFVLVTLACAVVLAVTRSPLAALILAVYALIIDYWDREDRGDGEGR